MWWALLPGGCCCQAAELHVFAAAGCCGLLPARSCGTFCSLAAELCCPYDMLLFHQGQASAHC